MIECYDFDATSLPSPDAMPRLEKLELDGLRGDAAALIAKQWKGFAGLSIRGKRSPGWIRDNLGNPFFTWGDELGHAAVTQACRIYKTASTALDKLGEDADANAVRAILEKFVTGFNRFNAKHDVDTMMREQICEAFLQLAQRRPALVNEEEVQPWIEEWREF